jgi:LmbE family N-acetylglucosaminyl deacetylase
MQPLSLTAPTNRPLRLLCLGAHSDDIEIGAGATILKLLQLRPNTEVWWGVFSASELRHTEAQRSARQFLQRAGEKKVILHTFRDGYFPAQHAEIKDKFEALKGYVNPDLILTHYRNDLHQDHRIISELTRNTWRNHTLLEYEIPKFDGDLDRPNAYVQIPDSLARRKAEYLMKYFPSQAKRPWFDRETFLGLMRLRGVECGARYAEAFHAHKLLLE